jgi:hypothetical protein
VKQLLRLLGSLPALDWPLLLLVLALRLALLLAPLLCFPWSLTLLQQVPHHQHHQPLLLPRLHLLIAAQRRPLAKLPAETGSCSCTDQASNALQLWLHERCQLHH